MAPQELRVRLVLRVISVRPVRQVPREKPALRVLRDLLERLVQLVLLAPLATPDLLALPVPQERLVPRAQPVPQGTSGRQA